MSQATTDLVSIREQIKAEIANSAQTFERPGTPRISTANKLFTLPDGTSNPGPMRVIILDYRNTRQYFPNPFNANNIKPPVCFAQAKAIPDLAPDPSCEQPQHESCTECPLNAWGSDPNGGKGKACKNGVRLALTPADSSISPVYILDVTPTGLSSWNSLMSACNQLGQDPIQFIVDISFSPTATYPSLVFQTVGENARLEDVWPLRTDAQPLLAKHQNAD